MFPVSIGVTRIRKKKEKKRGLLITSNILWGKRRSDHLSFFKRGPLRGSVDEFSGQVLLHFVVVWLVWLVFVRARVPPSQSALPGSVKCRSLGLVSGSNKWVHVCCYIYILVCVCVYVCL